MEVAQTQVNITLYIGGFSFKCEFYITYIKPPKRRDIKSVYTRRRKLSRPPGFTCPTVKSLYLQIDLMLPNFLGYNSGKGL